MPSTKQSSFSLPKPKEQLPHYDPLRDPNLRIYFQNPTIRSHLLNSLLVDKSGRILGHSPAVERIVEQEFQRLEKRREILERDQLWELKKQKREIESKKELELKKKRVKSMRFSVNDRQKSSIISPNRDSAINRKRSKSKSIQGTERDSLSKSLGPFFASDSGADSDRSVFKHRAPPPIQVRVSRSRNEKLRLSDEHEDAVSLKRLRPSILPSLPKDRNVYSSHGERSNNYSGKGKTFVRDTKAFERPISQQAKRSPLSKPSLRTQSSQGQRSTLPSNILLSARSQKVQNGRLSSENMEEWDHIIGRTQEDIFSLSDKKVIKLPGLSKNKKTKKVPKINQPTKQSKLKKRLYNDIDLSNDAKTIHIADKSSRKLSIDENKFTISDDSSSSSSEKVAAKPTIAVVEAKIVNNDTKNNGAQNSDSVSFNSDDLQDLTLSDISESFDIRESDVDTVQKLTQHDAAIIIQRNIRRKLAFTKAKSLSMSGAEDSESSNASLSYNKIDFEFHGDALPQIEVTLGDSESENFKDAHANKLSEDDAAIIIQRNIRSRLARNRAAMLQAAEKIVKAANGDLDTSSSISSSDGNFNSNHAQHIESSTVATVDTKKNDETILKVTDEDTTLLEEKSAMLIQRNVRAMLARNRVTILRNSMNSGTNGKKEEDKENIAATIIQRNVRGFLARKHVSKRWEEYILQKNFQQHTYDRHYQLNEDNAARIIQRNVRRILQLKRAKILSFDQQSSPHSNDVMYKSETSSSRDSSSKDTSPNTIKIEKRSIHHPAGDNAIEENIVIKGFPTNENSNEEQIERIGEHSPSTEYSAAAIIQSSFPGQLTFNKVLPMQNINLVQQNSNTSNSAPSLPNYSGSSETFPLINEDDLNFDPKKIKVEDPEVKTSSLEVASKISSIKNDAAIVIQRNIRRMQAKKRVENIKRGIIYTRSKFTSEEDKAAVIIQRNIRRKLAFKLVQQRRIDFAYLRASLERKMKDSSLKQDYTKERNFGVIQDDSIFKSANESTVLKEDSFFKNIDNATVDQSGETTAFDPELKIVHPASRIPEISPSEFATKNDLIAYDIESGKNAKPVLEHTSYQDEKEDERSEFESDYDEIFENDFVNTLEVEASDEFAF